MLLFEFSGPKLVWIPDFGSRTKTPQQNPPDRNPQDNNSPDKKPPQSKFLCFIFFKFLWFLKCKTTDSAMVTSITSGRLLVFKKPFASHTCNCHRGV